MSDLIAPPSDVAPSELFAKLLERPFPSEVFDFPRAGAGKIRIRVLSQEDQDRARVTAHRKMRERNKDISGQEFEGMVMREVVGDAIAREIIAIACLTEKSAVTDQNGNPVYGRIFPDGDSVSKLMPDEVAVLWRAWQLVQRKFGPLPSNVDALAWIRILKEGASALPLARLSWPDAVEIIMSSAELMSSLCGTLESQFATLPPHLQSELTKYRLGTGYWSAPAENSTDGKGLTLPIESYDEPLDIDDAIAFAERMRRQETLIENLQE